MAFQSSQPYATGRASNVVGRDPQTGRRRCGVRPGLTAFTSGVTGAPYNWCPVSYVNSGTKIGVSVVTANGAFVWNGASWSEHITTAPGTDFSTVACYLQQLYMARGGDTLIRQSLTGAAGAGATITPSAGTVPTNCGIVCAHGDRLFVAGDTSNPHVVYACKIADPTDWDYSVTNDDSAAWVSSGPTGGAISEPVTALLEHTRDCLLIGCTDSTYVIRGNPITGETVIISHEVGPLMQSAWCHDSQGTCYIFTRDGLYMMPPGCGDFLKSVSRESLPDELVAVNPGAGDKVSIAYDHRWRGLHIYVTYGGSETDVYYFFDLQDLAWWPMAFASNAPVLGVPIKRSMTTEKSGLVAFTSAGAGFQFDRDSTESIAAELWLGPIMLGPDGYEGIFHSLTARISELNSGGEVPWEIYVGDSPEEAFFSTAAFTGDAWDVEGLNCWQHVRSRGNAAYVRLFTTDQQRWAFEGAPARLTLSAMSRRG